MVEFTAKKIETVIRAVSDIPKKFSGNMQDILKDQIKLLKMKTKMSEMKNTLVRMNGKSGIAEGKISKVEGIAIGTIQKDTEREKIILGRGKKTQSIRDLGDDFEQPNVCIIGVIELGDREDRKKYLRNIDKNFS